MNYIRDRLENKTAAVAATLAIALGGAACSEADTAGQETVAAGTEAGVDSQTTSSSPSPTTSPTEAEQPVVEEGNSPEAEVAPEESALSPLLHELGATSEDIRVLQMARDDFFASGQQTFDKAWENGTPPTSESDCQIEYSAPTDHYDNNINETSRVDMCLHIAEKAPETTKVIYGGRFIMPQNKANPPQITREAGVTTVNGLYLTGGVLGVKELGGGKVEQGGTAGGSFLTALTIKINHSEQTYELLEDESVQIEDSGLEIGLSWGLVIDDLDSARASTNNDGVEVDYWNADGGIETAPIADMTL